MPINNQIQTSHGGKRVGAGRRKGSVNKVTAEIRDMASQYTQQALEGLLSIAQTSDSDSARVSAWKEILDRGHGKSLQSVAVGVDVSFSGLMARIDGKSRGLPKA